MPEWMIYDQNYAQIYHNYKYEESKKVKKVKQLKQLKQAKRDCGLGT